MRFKLLVLGLVLSCVASAQWTGYTRIANKYRYLAGAFDSTLHVPSGATVGLRGGANYRGALFYNTTDSSLYAYTGTQWLKASGSGTVTAGEGLTESPAGTFKIGGTISGSDTTLFSVTGASTSVRFKGNNGLGQKFIIDSIRNIYFRGQATNTQISIVNNAVTLQSYNGSAYSNALFSGGFLTFSGTDSIAYTSNAGVYRFDNVPTSDTSSGKPAVLTSDGKLKKLSNWGFIDLSPVYTVDLNNSDTLDTPGLYVITDGSVGGPAFTKIMFPDPSLHSGATIYLVNEDAVNDAYFDNTYDAVNPSGTSFVKFNAGYSYIFKSDGTNWICVSRYTGTTD